MKRVRWLPLALMKDDIPPEDWPAPINRVSGECVCEKCGERYDDHYQPAKLTCPTLVIVCDGTWYKL